MTAPYPGLSPIPGRFAMLNVPQGAARSWADRGADAGRLATAMDAPLSISATERRLTMGLHVLVTGMILFGFTTIGLREDAPRGLLLNFGPTMATLSIVALQWVPGWLQPEVWPRVAARPLSTRVLAVVLGLALLVSLLVLVLVGRWTWAVAALAVLGAAHLVQTWRRIWSHPTDAPRPDWPERSATITALSRLALAGAPVSVPRLARECGLPVAETRAIVERLQRQGFVRQAAWRVFITGDGARWVDRFRRALDES